MKTSTHLLDPKLLGFWARCIRETAHISQDALAALAGVDVRTVQRFEVGQPVSLTTRRSLARGLGYDNIDIFDDPTFASTVNDLFRELRAVQQQEIDQPLSKHAKLQTQRVKNGHTLGRFAEISNATMFSSDDEISDKAKEVAASMFDYLRDMMDISDDLPFADGLAFDRELEGMLRELERLGAHIYIADQRVKLCGTNWKDKTPIPIQIGYLTVVPAGKKLTQLLVPRQAQFS